VDASLATAAVAAAVAGMAETAAAAPAVSYMVLLCAVVLAVLHTAAAVTASAQYCLYECSCCSLPVASTWHLWVTTANLCEYAAVCVRCCAGPGRSDGSEGEAASAHLLMWLLFDLLGDMEGA
jgi:hypothetical protein